MYRLDKYNVKLDIDLENSIYIFDPDSSTGKSRLYWLIREYMEMEKEIYSVSYGDILRGENPAEIIAERNPVLVMFDRFDMYINQGYKELLKSLSDRAIVLVDYKGEEKITNGSAEWLAFLDVQLDKIEVYSV